MRLRWLIVVLIPYFIFAGCKMVTEGDRQTIDQTEKAGDFIRKESTQPVVAKAGEDVRDNAAVLKLHLGVPTEPTPPYSPQASEAARKRAEGEHEQANDIWKMALAAIGSHIPYGGMIVTGLVALNEFFKKRKAIQATYAVVRGVSALPRALSSETDAGKKEDISNKIKEVMESVAKSEGVHRHLDDMIGAWKHAKRLEKLA